MKQKILLLGIIAIVVVGVVMALGGTDTSTKNGTETGDPPQDDPADAALSFYNQWLTARNATDTDPAASGLYDSPFLQEGMKEKLEQAANDRPELDPVLCQEAIPEKIGAKPLFKEDYRAKTLIVARGTKLPGQAAVTLVAEDSQWVISEISCTFGEEAPEKGEFTFEEEGQLLKSVPAPLDSNFWHLIYERDGVMGYNARLIFDGESMCTDEGGTESVCDEGSFTETDTAFIQGDMSEAGLMVKRVQLK